MQVDENTILCGFLVFKRNRADREHEYEKVSCKRDTIMSIGFRDVGGDHRGLPHPLQTRRLARRLPDHT
jgi:hypothetical protein